MVLEKSDIWFRGIAGIPELLVRGASKSRRLNLYHDPLVSARKAITFTHAFQRGDFDSVLHSMYGEVDIWDRSFVLHGVDCLPRLFVGWVRISYRAGSGKQRTR